MGGISSVLFVIFVKLLGGGGGGGRRTKVKRLNISIWFDTSERVVTWSPYG